MDSDVEVALKYEGKLREDLAKRLDKRLDRMQTMDRIKAIGWILVGLFLSSNPQMVPFLKALME